MRREYEVEENGFTYVVQEYEDGTIVKNIKGTPGPEAMEEVISEEQQAELELQANVEYLVALKEMEVEL